MNKRSIKYDYWCEACCDIGAVTSVAIISRSCCDGDRSVSPDFTWTFFNNRFLLCGRHLQSFLWSTGPLGCQPWSETTNGSENPKMREVDCEWSRRNLQPFLVHHPLHSDCSLLGVHFADSLKAKTDITYRSLWIHLQDETFQRLTFQVSLYEVQHGSSVLLNLSWCRLLLHCDDSQSRLTCYTRQCKHNGALLSREGPI